MLSTSVGGVEGRKIVGWEFSNRMGTRVWKDIMKPGGEESKEGKIIIDN